MAKVISKIDIVTWIIFMSKKKDYSKIGIYYLIGTLFQKGIAFLTVPVFTRIMGTDDYGLVSTYNSWLAILSMLISAALYMGLRLAFVDYKEDINNFLSSITTFAIIDGFVFCIGVVTTGLLVGSRIFLALALVCVLQATAEAILIDLTQFYVMQYRYKIRTVLMIIPPLLSSILSIIVILIINKEKYLGRILPTALVSIAFGIILSIAIYKKSTVIIKKEYIVYGLKISAPLILHGVALNILGSSDRIMITSLRNSSETGIYSLVYNVGMLATALTTALDGIWSPWFIHSMRERLSQKHDLEDEENTKGDTISKTELINNSFRLYLNGMTFVMISIILVGPEIVKLLADKRYWEGIPIIPPIVLANYMIFVYTFYVGVEHFYKKTLFISINTLIAAGLNILLNIIYIPKLGYFAAAYTTLVAYFFSLILHMLRSRKLDKELFVWQDVLLPLMIVAISVIIFYVFIEFFIVRWVLAALSVACLGIIHKDIIVEYLKSS